MDVLEENFMETYNINDLYIGSYTFKHIVWSKGKRLQTIGAYKSVLYPLSNGDYKDVITNAIVAKSDILGVKPFIARDELLSKTQIIYIFKALENANIIDTCDDIVSYEEFTPFDLIKDTALKATTKVKKLGSRFKK